MHGSFRLRSEEGNIGAPRAEGLTAKASQREQNRKTAMEWDVGSPSFLENRKVL